MEHLLSLQYMADTPSFVSKLDNDGYMPLTYLASLPSIQCFDLSVSELIDVIRAIDALSLSPDNKGVRISLPVALKTLIIRDTPEGTSEDVIRSLLPEFAIESIREEIGRSWFVTFPSEEDVPKAISALQSMTLDGQPVKARVKSEFYMKVFMRRLQTVMATTKATANSTKLSSAARPFELPPDRLKELHENVKKVHDYPTASTTVPGFDSYWTDPNLYPNLKWEVLLRFYVASITR